MTSPPPRRAYRYYDLVMAAFVTVLLCANLIGASKVAQLWGMTFGAGVLFFALVSALERRWVWWHVSVSGMSRRTRQHTRGNV
jgi:hypothetical protein